MVDAGAGLVIVTIDPRLRAGVAARGDSVTGRA